MFPRKKINIYLSPNVTQELQDWEEDEILIIREIVDLAQSKPLNKAKKKRDGIRSAKLPLDQHVARRANRKSLPSNQIIGMLADFQSCKNWRQAIVADVASRNLESAEEIEEERYRAERVKFDPFFIHLTRDNLMISIKTSKMEVEKVTWIAGVTETSGKATTIRTGILWRKEKEVRRRRILLNRMISLKNFCK